MTTAVVEPWVEAPLHAFVRDSGAVIALLLHPSGQVMAQHGFARAVDVMSACALAAAIHASSGELGRTLDGRAFRELHHAGIERGIYLTETVTPRGQFLLLAVFDSATSLGIVRLYAEEFGTALSAAAPEVAVEREPALAVNFERDLNRNLAALFGRA
jgi:hypothetical protein